MQKRYLPPEILKRCRELRSSQTPAEAKLWACLRNNQLFGYKFRRQHPVGKFIIDFYCQEAKLAIELDGGGHAGSEQAKYDEERTECLKAEGIRVLRFWNTDVFENLEGVVEAIANAIPSPFGRG
jgi:very-short-patch-repair endonuclease